VILVLPVRDRDRDSRVIAVLLVSHVLRVSPVSSEPLAPLEETLRV